MVHGMQQIQWYSSIMLPVHFDAGELNSGTDGLSRLQMTDEIPTNLISEIYAIDELDSNNNFDFPLAMSLIKQEQERDEKIQESLHKAAYAAR